MHLPRRNRYKAAKRNHGVAPYSSCVMRVFTLSTNRRCPSKQKWRACNKREWINARTEIDRDFLSSVFAYNKCLRTELDAARYVPASLERVNLLYGLGFLHPTMDCKNKAWGRMYVERLVLSFGLFKWCANWKVYKYNKYNSRSSKDDQTTSVIYGRVVHKK